MEVIEYLSLVWVFYSISEFINDRLDLKLDSYFCLRCWCFWIVLLYTFDPFLSAMVALSGEILDRLILNKKIEI